MVIQLENGRFAKDCPYCGIQQTYLRKNYAVESEALGKRCKACANNDPKSNSHKGYYKGVLRASFAHKYKTGAETRGIEFNVSFDYLADLLIEQDFECALSGESLDAMELNNNASLDRIDSSLGYIEGNVQWVTSEVNMMKQSYSQARFIEVCKAVADKVKW
jgi:hypothetical protein